MKKLKLLILLLIPGLTFSDSKNNVPLPMISSKDFPKNGDGIKVVPLSKMPYPESIKKMMLLNAQLQKKKAIWNLTQNIQ